jgi:hypothetical protein
MMMTMVSDFLPVQFFVVLRDFDYAVEIVDEDDHVDLTLDLF